MRQIKTLFDPQDLLNPGVLICDDADSHVKNLKPLPQCDAIVDKCIECGFCEPKCPSRGLTLSPRQRIVGLREISRLRCDAQSAAADALQIQYDYQGIDTCATCGLCETACPVGIDTGQMIKALRVRRPGAVARRVATGMADHFSIVTAGLRAGLTIADLLHGVVGTRLMQRSLGGARRLSGGRLAKWSPTMPRSARFTPPPLTRHQSADRVIYFPSCAARTMGAQRGDDTEPLPVVAERLFRKAGFDVVFPRGLAELCCGQPFESKGLVEAADGKTAELVEALREASENGRWPIVFDTSPCTYRLRRLRAAGLAVHDSIEFVHDTILPRVTLTPVSQPVVVHPVCSVRKMGSVDKIVALAERCSAQVVSVPDVLCCGFAGDKGFNTPELNEHALRFLKSAIPAGCTHGYSSSRTCEIGLSEQAGFPYHSIIHLVEARARPPAAGSHTSSPDN
jgi:D-lactate dehydrogenase